MATQIDMFGSAAFRPKRTAADIERERLAKAKAQSEAQERAAAANRQRIRERNLRIRTALARKPDAAAFAAWARTANPPADGEVELAALTRATLARIDRTLAG